mmetsp:Transcript_12268/g.40287  ORF Transcript_12268/g.40287 Transcript_12268/m.40287 type:complete len:246 (+) Transcript_12268:683-1420(+)
MHGGVERLDHAPDGVELRVHARLVVVEVGFRALHQRREAPERLHLVLHHHEDGREQVRHPLAVPQIEIVKDVRRQDAPHLRHRLAVVLRKVRVRAVRAHHILVDAVAPIPKLGEARALESRHRLPLAPEHVVLLLALLTERRPLCGCAFWRVEVEQEGPNFFAEPRLDAAVEDALAQARLVEEPPRRPVVEARELVRPERRRAGPLPRRHIHAWQAIVRVVYELKVAYAGSLAAALEQRRPGRGG